MSCDDLVSIDDLEKTNVRSKHLGEVIDGTTSGTSTNPLTGKTLKTLPRVITEGEQTFKDAAEAMGWFPVAGSFEAGGTITARNQVLWWEAAKSWYSWNGTLPKTVAAGSTPATSGGFGSTTGWTDRTDATLRSQLLERPLYKTIIGLYGLGDHSSVKDYGATGDGTYHPVQEWIDDGIFPTLADIQFAYPKVTSLTQSIDWAATQTCADDNRGGEFTAPKAQYVITDTVVVPKGTTMWGQGKFDIWENDTTVGTCYLTHGPGNPQRWTDIDGSDPADDTPMFVAGGPGVYFRNMALRSDTWSVGLFYPSVRQCGFSQILALGFTDAPIYLDLTWSTRNTVMCALHPDIETDGGMNEFSGFDVYARTSAPGAFAVKMQGTTRPGTAVATADEWQWGYGGCSDARITHGRLNGGGVGGGCFKHDGQLFGTSLAQGFTLRDVALRLHGSGDYYAYLDRSNRVIIDGAYGEHASGGVGKVSVTSRTQASVDGILFVNDRLGGRMYKDGVDVGSLQTPDWQDSRCVQMYKVSGRISTPNIKALDVEQAVEFTSWDEEYGFVFYSDNGTGRTQEYAMSKSNFRPQQNGRSLGSTNHPWESVQTEIINSPMTSNITVGNPIARNSGEMDLRSSGTGYGVRVREGVETAFLATSSGLTTSGSAFSVAPSADNVVPMCLPSKRATTIYLGTAPNVTSDERQKANILPIDDVALDAWGNVQYYRYELIDGTSHRQHTGCIVQRIIKAFSDAGLDALEYGLCCHEEWEAKPATYEVIPATYEVVNAVFDKEGKEIEPEKKILLTESYEVLLDPAEDAGDIWTLRYDEVYAFEAAYQRRRADRLEARIAAIEAKLQ